MNREALLESSPLPQSSAETHVSSRNSPLPQSSAETHVSRRTSPLPQSSAEIHVSSRNSPLSQSSAETHVSRRTSPLPLAGEGLGVRVAVLAAILCTSCTVGPDFKRPAQPEVPAYTREPVAATATAPVAGGGAQTFKAGTEVPERWWTGFGSPAIDHVVERAFQHNPTVDAAKAALRQAHESTAAQFGAYFPVVQANYSASRSENAVGTIAPTLSSGAPVYTLHTAQVSVGFVPDVFGLNRRTVESLAAQEESQRFQLEAAYLTLASNVVAAAIQQAALQAQVTAAEDIIGAERRSLQLLREQARLGYASGLDVASQESALAQAEQLSPPLQKQLEQTRDLLAVLAGDLPGQVGSGEAGQPAGAGSLDLDALTLPEELPLSVPSTLIEHRPDVRAAEALVHAASAEVGVAVANRLPQFSISANYGGTATQFAKMFAEGDRFWAITGSVTQTIFDFGTLQHRQRATEAALDQATAQYRSVVLSAFQNVADSLYALKSDADALAASVTAEAAARKTLDLTRRQLDAGAVNVLALLSAQQAYQQTRISRVQAQAARYTDTAALYQALGGGRLGGEGALARENP
jgi:NodT family efflux transporter outer membrane factor (OMF) lipoprotein